MIGGLDKDILIGGGGADIFDFNSVTESLVATPDTLSNFKWSEGDKIDLSTFDADLTLVGNQAFSLAQLTFNSGAETLLADVIGGADLLVSLTGV
ncbi:M10 family metallopeptidase C-terminal domain-containing protein [Nitrosomonas ureae]|uniref:M10 family metallopeptidase C-terminal domain-containing protein n=1 Tax=Nitrosomonas ureae TaxID=44577 RepID=UPI000D76E4E3